MRDPITANEMRAIEEAAMASGRVTGAALMQRAGEEVVEAIWQTYPTLAEGQHKAVVLCGPGNNGGDGFAIARLLNARGWEVVVYFFGDADKLSADARGQHDAWAKVGAIHPFTDDTQRDPRLYDPMPDLWVDAIFGIGLNRALPERVTRMLHRVYYEQNWNRAPVVAVDIISGLSSDTGQSVQPFHLTADLTVTFHAPKVGHLKGDGPMRSGQLVVADIGLDDD